MCWIPWFSLVHYLTDVTKFFSGHYLSISHGNHATIIFGSVASAVCLPWELSTPAAVLFLCNALGLLYLQIPSLIFFVGYSMPLAGLVWSGQCLHVICYSWFSVVLVYNTLSLTLIICQSCIFSASTNILIWSRQASAAMGRYIISCPAPYQAVLPASWAIWDLSAFHANDH